MHLTYKARTTIIYVSRKFWIVQEDEICMYFSFLPDPFNFFKSFSVISFSPLSRKTTIPMCLSAGISKRSSEATKASNCFAKWTPFNNIKIGLRAYYGQKWKIICLNILFVVMIFYASYLTNVRLQSFNAIITDDEPQLQSSKPFAERNLPVLIKYIKIIIQIRYVT